MYPEITNTLLSYWPLYTDEILEVLSEAPSLRSSCELGNDVKDLNMIDRMLLIYLVLFAG
jgi:hypothetical protein